MAPGSPPLLETELPPAADGASPPALWGLSRPALDAGLAPALFTLLAIVLIARDQGGYFPTAWGWSVIVLLGVVLTWAIAGGFTDAGRLDLAFFAALVLLTVWAGLSISWSIDRPQSVLELERWLVLVAGCGAFLLLARRAAVQLLAVAIVVAISSICIYSLSTRLFPGRLGGTYDPTAGYRLFQPVGYWNALGIFAIIGTVIAFGLVSQPGLGVVVRLIGAISLTVLPVTAYFTFSRGSWLALAGGILVAISLSPHRSRLATETAVFAVAPGIGVLFASRSQALTHQNAVLAAANHQGHRLAAIVLALCVVSAALVPAVTWAEGHLRFDGRRPRVYGASLVAVAILVVAAGLVRGGGPVSIAKRGYDSFVASEATSAADKSNPNLNGRLFTVNGNGRAKLWSVAFDAVKGHWVGGTGAGSFERNWDASPKQDEFVRDAHGLFIETLSELGIVGLLLIVGLLALPFVAAVKARAVPVVPAVAGAYTAFVLHNGIDWDWELSGVALAGLLTGCLLLVAHRQGAERAIAVPVRAVGGVAVLAVAGFALVAAVGNGALARAQTANQQKRYAAAASQATIARRWMPWSPEPLLALGQAQLEQSDLAGASASFRKAISIDPRDWLAWLDLAAAEKKGPARARAAAEAKRLYPASPQVRDFIEDYVEH